MARLLTNADIWSHVTAVGVLRDVSGGMTSTVAVAATAKGDTSIEVAAIGTLTTDDPFRVGDDNNEEVGFVESVSSNVITTKNELAFAHEIGEALVEQERTVLGQLTDDGVDVEHQADRNQINAATRRERLGFLIGNTNDRVTFALRNHSLENIMAAMGVPEGNIGGAGTAADSSTADLTHDDWDTVENQAFYFTGALKNGTTVEVHLWRTEMDPNSTISYVRGQAADIPFALDGGHVRYFSPAITPV